MQDTIERQISVGAPKERVFDALTDPDKLAKWFPDAVEGQVAAGERPVFDFGEYGKQRIYVVAADRSDYFAFRWVSSSEGDFMGDALEAPSTLVEFWLSDEDGGTLVKLKESGFASLPEAVAQKSLSDNSGGWDYCLGRLAELMQS
jgi:uncharacterized protein YndB with AHSA1/START domain